MYVIYIYIYIYIYVSAYVHNYYIAVETVFYGNLGTEHKCPDYQSGLILQVSLYV